MRPFDEIILGTFPHGGHRERLVVRAGQDDDRQVWGDDLPAR